MNLQALARGSGRPGSWNFRLESLGGGLKLHAETERGVVKATTEFEGARETLCARVGQPGLPKLLG